MENSIDRFQLITWKHAIKLEMLGMHRRGRSCLSIVKDAFGLKKSTPANIVLEIVVLTIEEMNDAK
jgi:hypothetical protein